MAQELATISFYLLVIIVFSLQANMMFRRVRFLKAIRGHEAELMNFKEPKVEDFGTIFYIMFPFRLTKSYDGQIEELRKSAMKATKYYLISIPIAFFFPVLLFALISIFE